MPRCKMEQVTSALVGVYCVGYVCFDRDVLCWCVFVFYMFSIPNMSNNIIVANIIVCTVCCIHHTISVKVKVKSVGGSCVYKSMGQANTAVSYILERK